MFSWGNILICQLIYNSSFKWENWLFLQNLSQWCICLIVHVSVCIYVCACVYMCVYMCVYIYICVCVYACVYMYVYVCVYMCVYIYVCVCMYLPNPSATAGYGSPWIFRWSKTDLNSIFLLLNWLPWTGLKNPIYPII